MESSATNSSFSGFPPKVWSKIVLFLVPGLVRDSTRITLQQAIRYQTLANNRQLRKKMLPIFYDAVTILIDASTTNHTFERFTRLLRESTGDLTCFWHIKRIAFCFPCGDPRHTIATLGHSAAFQISSTKTACVLEVMHGAMEGQVLTEEIGSALGKRQHIAGVQLHDQLHTFEGTNGSLQPEQICGLRSDLNRIQIHLIMMVRGWSGTRLTREKILEVCDVIERRAIDERKKVEAVISAWPPAPPPAPVGRRVQSPQQPPRISRGERSSRLPTSLEW